MKAHRKSVSLLCGFVLALTGREASAGKVVPGIAPTVAGSGRVSVPSDPSPVDTVQARSATPTQRALMEAAEHAGLTVEWDSRLTVPSSIRGNDLSIKNGFSAGRGLRVRGGGRAVDDAVAVMDNLSGLFRIADAENEFHSKKTQTDKLGFYHHRLQQTHRGLPVVGGEVVVHFNKAGKAYQVNGRYVPDIAINVTPSISVAQAEATAHADLRAMKKPAGTLAGTPKPVVFARRDPPRLAYELTLTYKDDATGPGRWMYWIDALTGAVIDRFNNIREISTPTSNGNLLTVYGARLAGEGGGHTNFTAWYDNINTNYYLYHTGRVWMVENAATSGYLDANTYAYRATNDWGASDRVEISAALDFDDTQKYYSQRHSLFGFDGLGAMARANVHEGVNYVNAYWDGLEFYFGDGDGVIADSLVVLDVVGHEFTHAVTEYSANLVYQNEPGALNESFSDIFGTCVEFYNQSDERTNYPGKSPGGADWLCGEDCRLSSIALRDLRNPANAATVGAGNEQPTRYLGAYWYTGAEDNGGVHQNSGVQNFFFYLLCEGGSGSNDGIIYNLTGIGITNAEQVAFRALTVYCTSDTGYRIVRSAWISAAQDLNPAWVSSVCDAWDAVGVQAVSVTPASGVSFSGSESGPFAPSTFIYTIRNDDSAATGWGMSHAQTWVTVAPTSGSIPAFGSQAVTVTINSAASGLTAGSYMDTLAFTNSTSSVSEDRSVTLLVLPPIVYQFDLSSDPGWTTEGQWEYGSPRGFSGDPSSGATGPNVYGYNLAGAYPNDMPVYALTTPALDCSGYTNLQLSFWQWLGVESADFDHATIQVSGNGTSWITVWDHTGASFQDMSWQNFIYNLSVVDGQRTVYLRWLMGPTDSSVAYSGWNIDDIRIHGTPRDNMWIAPGDGLTSQGYEGGPFSPSNQVYQLVNAGLSSLNWTAGSASSWVTVDSSGGLLPSGATTNLTIWINSQANMLTQGVYRATVVITNVTSGVGQTRSVYLMVKGPPPVPFNPIPTNGAVGVTTTTKLSWNNTGFDSSADIIAYHPSHDIFLVRPNGSKDALHIGPKDYVDGLDWVGAQDSTFYDVYLGTSLESMLRVATNLTITSYDPQGLLAVDTTYYWRVTASNDAGVVTGPIWSFITAIALPYSLIDGSNYLWDIQGDGVIINGSADAYDGGHVYSNFPSFTSGTLVGGRQVVIGQATIGVLRVTRKIYVPSNKAFCRFLEVLYNSGATTITGAVPIDTNLGSDSGTIIDSTSSGDLVWGTNDDWIVTDDGDGAGDPTVIHVVANPYGQIRQSAVRYSTDFISYDYNVALAPGQTKIVMHFGAQNLNRSIARTNAVFLTNLGAGTLDLMTASEINQVVNFGPWSGGEIDTDGDGMPDWWETMYGLNPTISNASGSNADGDRMTDLDEYIADTNPTNDLSYFPRMTALDRSIGTMSIIVNPTSTGRLYRTLWTTNLLALPLSWNPYGESRTGNNIGIIFVLTNDAPNRYYRTGVRLPYGR